MPACQECETRKGKQGESMRKREETKKKSKEYPEKATHVKMTKINKTLPKTLDTVCDIYTSYPNHVEIQDECAQFVDSIKARVGKLSTSMEDNEPSSIKLERCLTQTKYCTQTLFQLIENDDIVDSDSLAALDKVVCEIASSFENAKLSLQKRKH